MTLTDLFRRPVAVADDVGHKAKFYLSDNRSVIPVRPDKRPAIKAWVQYQSEPMTTDAAALHFKRAHGLALVCGRVSGLICADFDDVDAYRRFVRDNPELATTYTETTPRGGRHLLYAVLGDTVIRSRPGKHGDLKAEGAYVVMAPTPGYEFADVAVHYEPVTEYDLEVLMQYLGIDDTTGDDDSSAGRVTPDTDDDRAAEGTAPDVRAAEAVEHLKRYAERIGRNNALYRVALSLRGDVQQVVAERVLVPVYASMPPTAATKDRKHETPRQRSREATATIASAYRRAVRADARLLPNVLREKLLNAPRGVTVARVLDTLYMLGVSADQIYTERDLVELVAVAGVTRDSVRAVLDFGRAVADVLSGDAVDDVNTETDVSTLKTDADEFCVSMTPKQSFVDCFDASKYLGSIYTQNSTEGKRGRKPRVLYRIPGVVELCARFGVTDARADALTLDDVSSAAAYRAGLHLALARRVQNGDRVLTRRFLARRLGVSVSTTRRYERSRGIRAAVVVKRRTLSFTEVNALRPDGDTCARFVEIDGKPYAYAHHHKGTFLRALNEGRAVTLCTYTGVRLTAHAVRAGDDDRAAEGTMHDVDAEPVAVSEPLVAPDVGAAAVRHAHVEQVASEPVPLVASDAYAAQRRHRAPEVPRAVADVLSGDAVDDIRAEQLVAVRVGGRRHD